MATPRFTPENIDSLQPNEIFVFGSNEAGFHGAGAAKVALEKFGAKMYFAQGKTGQCYAIPTKDSSLRTLGLHDIEIYILRFLEYAKHNPDYTFLVTKIGCGLAGYRPKDIAPLFRLIPNNVILPKEFHEIIYGNTQH